MRWRAYRFLDWRRLAASPSRRLMTQRGALAGGGNAVRANVGPQNFWHGDRSIFLLIILHERNPRASDRESRAVERVHEFAFAALGLESNPRPARLKRLAV